MEICFFELKNVKQWRVMLAQRASIQQAVTEDYPERLTVFLSKRQSYIAELIGQAQPRLLENTI